jgi:hypothetical protein
MLAGTKPLAAFSDAYPSLHGRCVIPEREFEPHVAAGRIIKRQYIEPPGEGAHVVKGQRIGMRRVLYALPGEHRHDARRRGTGGARTDAGSADDASAGRFDGLTS